MSTFWVWHCLLPLLSAPCIAGSELFQSGPARVGFLGCARALALIEIGAAIRAQPAAIIAAHSGHRDGELYLLAHYIVEIQRIIPIERDEQIILGQLSFFVGLQ